MNRLNPSLGRYTSFAWLVTNITLLLFMVLDVGQSGSLLFSALAIMFFLILTVLSIGAYRASLTRHTWGLGKSIEGILQMPRTGSIALAGIIMLIGIVWALVPINSTRPALTLLHIYILGWSLTSFALALRIRAYSDTAIANRRSLLLAGLWIGCAALLVLIYVGRIPHLSLWDEPAEINWARALFKGQGFFWPMFPTRPPEQVAVGYSIPNVIAGGWMHLIGFGVAQARFFFLLAGWLSLPFIYETARRLYNTQVALMATILGAFIPLTYNYARPDMFIVLTTSLALYFYVRAHAQNQLIFHYGVGVALGFGLEGHPYASRFILTFTLLYGLKYARLLLTQRRWCWNPAFWAFVFGGVTYALFFIALHILIVPQNVLLTLSSVYNHQTTYSTYSGYLVRLIGENWRYIKQYFQLHLLEFVLNIIVLWAAWVRRLPADRMLLMISLLSQSFGAFFLAHVSLYYWVFDMPFLAILSGAFVVQIGQKLIGQSLKPVFVTWGSFTMVSLVATLLTADTIRASLERDPADQLIAIGRQIAAIVPNNTSIIGDPIFSLAMPDNEHFVSIENLYVDEWQNGLPAPQAFILTTGTGAIQPPIPNNAVQYLKTQPLSEAYCFYTDDGNQVSLYLPPTQVPPAGPVGCTNP